MPKKKTTKTTKTVKSSTTLATNEAARDRMVADLLFNTATSRSQFIKQLMDPRRDIDDECGYPDEPDINDYKSLYDREPIANRVVSVLSQESWKVEPEVYEEDDLEKETKFEIALSELSKKIGGKGWFEGGEGDPLWDWLRRADELSGIGSFGTILLGIDDGKELNEAAAGIDEKGENVSGPDQELIYLRVFDESLVQVTSFETDKTNPRYGMPTNYNLTLNKAQEGSSGFSTLSTSTVKVHWSRIIHIADNLGSSELFGSPRLKPVYNRCFDLRKMYSSSAEMYWKGAFPGISFETHPQLGGEVEIDDDAFRTLMEKYQTGLQRYLRTTGMTAKSLAPQVVDPSPQIERLLESICIQIAVPKRIFMGSERGELSSGQDSDTWNDRLRYRQKFYLTPKVIVPFIDRLICLGILPEPKQYNVRWLDLDSLTEPEQATVAVQQTEALTKYVQGNVENLITPINFLVRVLKFSKDEAEKILQDTMDAEENEQLTISPEPEPGPMGFDSEGNPLPPGIPPTQLQGVVKEQKNDKKIEKKID